MRTTLTIGALLVTLSTFTQAASYEEFTTNLEDQITDAIVANSGNLIVIKHKEKSHLSIYNATSKKTDKINLSSSNFRYTAGGSSILVYFPEQNMFQLWNAKTLKKVKSFLNPKGQLVTSLTMGASNSNLAAIRFTKGTDSLSRNFNYLLNLKTQTVHKIDYPKTKRKTHSRLKGQENVFGSRNSSYRDFIHRRASPNMNFMTEWCASHSPSGVNLTRFTSSSSGIQVTSQNEHTAAGFLNVGNNGIILTGSKNIYGSNLRVIAQHDCEFMLPSISGFLNLGFQKDRKLYIYDNGGNTKLAELGDMPADFPSTEKKNRSSFNQNSGFQTPWAKTLYVADRHFIFVPTKGYLCLLPKNGSVIIQRDFNLKTLLSEQSKNFIIPTISNNLSAKLGSTVTSNLSAISSGKSISYTIEVGFPGVAIVDKRLVWKRRSNSKFENKRTGNTRIILKMEDETGFKKYVSVSLTAL